MYRILGADGREYGPVSAEQLRQWIAENRANAYTRVRAEGAAEWKVLSAFPEFAAAFANPPRAGSTPPLLGAAESEALTRELCAREYQLDIGRCFSRGWDLVMRRFWLTAGASLLTFFLAGAAATIPFGDLFLKFVFWGGLQWMFLRLVRGEQAEVGDAFAGFTLGFLPLLLFSAVAQLLVSIGLLLCLLPGIYLAVSWMLFTPLLILDKRLDFWPAMELSRKVVTRHWWQIFGLVLLCLLLKIAGALVCCLGFFIALPVTLAAVVYAYDDIFSARPAIPQAPPVS